MGLLGMDDVIALWPDLGLKITPKFDLGFWNQRHCEEKASAVFSELGKRSLKIMKAAVCIQTPYTIAVLFFSTVKGMVDVGH